MASLASPAAPASPTNSESDSLYLFHCTGRSWQVTSEIARQLTASGAWTAATATGDATPRFHLLLGDRGRVPYAQLVGRKAPSTVFQTRDHLALPSDCVLVNSYRGCNDLTNKSALCKTMRHFAREHQLTAQQLEFLPATFVLRAGDLKDERDLFLAEYERVQSSIAASSASAAAASSAASPASAAPSKNAWIVKANRGAKGNSIFVSDAAAKLIAYVDARVDADPAAPHVSAAAASVASLSAESVVATAASASAASAALASRAPPLRARSALHSRTSSLAVAAAESWVLQRYLSSPFLLHRRKFDIRAWVLLDAGYNIHLYRQGVCRLSSTEFSMDNLEDTFVHLTNHCIQEAHPEFSSTVQSNELFFPELQQYLDALPHSDLHPRLCVLCHLLPQIRRIVRATLESVRSSMSSSGEYSSFQLFGFDFMLDEHFRLHLLEINATPASAEKLLEGLVKAMLHTAIEPLFPTQQLAAASPLPASASSPYDPAAAPSAESILARACHCDGPKRAAKIALETFDRVERDEL